MKKYKGRISFIAALLLAIPILALGHYTFNATGNWIFRIIYIVGVMAFLHIVFAKNYQIGKENLLLKIAGFRSSLIPIKNIKRIEKLDTALDRNFKLDRLVLYYNTNRDFEYMRTPKKLKSFIQDLKEVNPAIEVDIPGQQLPTKEEAK